MDKKKTSIKQCVVLKNVADNFYVEAIGDGTISFIEDSNEACVFDQEELGTIISDIKKQTGVDVITVSIFHL